MNESKLFVLMLCYIKHFTVHVHITCNFCQFKLFEVLKKHIQNNNYMCSRKLDGYNLFANVILEGIM